MSKNIFNDFLQGQSLYIWADTTKLGFFFFKFVITWILKQRILLLDDGKIVKDIGWAKNFV